MQQHVQRVTPFLWYDSQAEEAARFYVSIFPNSRLVTQTQYTDASSAASGQPVGSVMTVAFELDGQAFVALNGGPHFKFTEAVSFVVNCTSQAEIDHYWNSLSAGGDEKAQQCGWLKDRYGLSWQIVPSVLPELLDAADADRSQRVTQALLAMKKIDIETLTRAHAGEVVA